jgi:hypothetical protein
MTAEDAPQWCVEGLCRSNVCKFKFAHHRSVHVRGAGLSRNKKTVATPTDDHRYPIQENHLVSSEEIVSGVSRWRNWTLDLQAVAKLCAGSFQTDWSRSASSQM